MTLPDEAGGVSGLLQTAASRAVPLDRKSRSARRSIEDATVSGPKMKEPSVKEGADRDLILLRDGSPLPTTCAICLLERRLDAGTDVTRSTPGFSPDRSSGLAARALNQLALSVWLPAALFAGSLTMLIQFRRADSIDILPAIQALTAAPIQALALAIPLFLITKVLAQTFSFGAIRTLEGYWRKRGLACLARTVLTRRQVRRKEAIIRRRRKATESAFFAAKTRMASKGISCAIIGAFEAQVLHKDLPSLTDEEARKFSRMNWRTLCDAWHLARVDHLLSQEAAYPATSRVLPTKLGNLIRATEDTLENGAGDVEGFALRHHGKMPQRLQMQHDQLRNRLAMFCTMVFLSIFLLVLTPIILAGSRIDLAAIGIIACSFAVSSVVSYLAAMASAGGYCIVLKQMDEISRNLDKGLQLPSCFKESPQFSRPR